MIRLRIHSSSPYYNRLLAGLHLADTLWHASSIFYYTQRIPLKLKVLFMLKQEAVKISYATIFGPTANSSSFTYGRHPRLVETLGSYSIFLFIQGQTSPDYLSLCTSSNTSSRGSTGLHQQSGASRCIYNCMFLVPLSTSVLVC